MSENLEHEDPNRCLALYDQTTLCLEGMKSLIEMAWKSNMQEAAIYILEDYCTIFRQKIDAVYNGRPEPDQG